MIQQTSGVRNKPRNGELHHSPDPEDEKVGNLGRRVVGYPVGNRRNDLALYLFICSANHTNHKPFTFSLGNRFRDWTLGLQQLFPSVFPSELVNYIVNCTVNNLIF